MAGKQWLFQSKSSQSLMRHPQGESWSLGKGEEVPAFKKDIQGLWVKTAQGNDRRKRLRRLLRRPGAYGPGSIPKGAL